MPFVRHSVFETDWDKKVIDMWAKEGDEMAVLSHYPPGVSSRGKLTKTSIVCGTSFLGEAFEYMPKHRDGRIIARTDRSRLTPIWGGGLSFSKAHRVRNVPYDAFTPQLFDGEEFGLGLRLFTHGYNTYNPSAPICYHRYDEETGTKRPRYWDKGFGAKKAAMSRSARRVWAMMGYPISEDYDKTDLDKYGLGTARTVHEYEQWSGVDIANRSVADDFCDRILRGLPLLPAKLPQVTQE